MLIQAILAIVSLLALIWAARGERQSVVMISTLLLMHSAGSMIGIKPAKAPHVVAHVIRM
jgi:hypothetical protein